MIKFFRTIRQNLLSEGKIGKYIKYAIGEILLVIIGILIALSINTLNENRKIKIEEQSLLKDLKEEMVSNLKGLEVVITEHEKSFQARNEIMALFRDRNAFNEISDSLYRSKIKKMNVNYTYDPSNGILNSIISSGRINQISNNELKYLLASLKEMTVDANESSLKIEAKRDELYYSTFENMTIIKNGQIIDYDFRTSYDYPKFRMLTGFLFGGIRRQGLEEERDLKATLEHIIELINQSIKK